jgi:hypothetical protein
VRLVVIDIVHELPNPHDRLSVSRSRDAHDPNHGSSMSEL